MFGSGDDETRGAMEGFVRVKSVAKTWILWNSSGEFRRK